MIFDNRGIGESSVGDVSWTISDMAEVSFFLALFQVLKSEIGCHFSARSFEYPGLWSLGLYLSSVFIFTNTESTYFWHFNGRNDYSAVSFACSS